MPNYQENVSENWNAHAKLALFPNMYQNKLPNECKKFLCLIMYARRYAKFYASCLSSEMKEIYVWHKEVWGKKTFKQSALKMMRIERKQVGDNMFNQELKDAKEKEDNHS